MKKLIVMLVMLLLIPTAFAAMTRDFSATSVGANTNVDITYTSSSTGFNGVEDTVPAGFTLITQNSLVSLNNNRLRVAWTGASTSVTLKSPATSGTYTFLGTYESTGSMSGVVSGDTTITVTGGNGGSPGGGSGGGSSFGSIGWIIGIAVVGFILYKIFNK